MTLDQCDRCKKTGERHFTKRTEIAFSIDPDVIVPDESIFEEGDLCDDCRSILKNAIEELAQNFFHPNE